MLLYLTPQQDMEDVDVAVPRASSMFIRTALASVEIIGMICWATPGSIIAVLPMLILYFYMLVSCLVCPHPLTVRQTIPNVIVVCVAWRCDRVLIRISDADRHHFRDSTSPRPDS